jgi:cytochrome c nitrite reductase small subunit
MPVRVAVIVGIAAGIFFGVGGYTFIYARGASYMTNDPAACVNCHVMNEQYDGWRKGSHRAVAVCNDCHAPHDIAGKYFTKALNGWNHSYAFTTGNFPDPIRITPRNREIAVKACLHCHAAVTHVMVPSLDREPPRDCLRCHARVGHM